jgi:hypothetical protein
MVLTLLLLLGWHNLRLLLHVPANKKKIEFTILISRAQTHFHWLNHAMQDSWDNPRTMTV